MEEIIKLFLFTTLVTNRIGIHNTLSHASLGRWDEGEGSSGFEVY